jgi:hypothetical protein
VWWLVFSSGYPPNAGAQFQSQNIATWVCNGSSDTEKPFLSLLFFLPLLVISNWCSIHYQWYHTSAPYTISDITLVLHTLSELSHWCSIHYQWYHTGAPPTISDITLVLHPLSVISHWCSIHYQWYHTGAPYTISDITLVLHTLSVRSQWCSIH